MEAVAPPLRLLQTVRYAMESGESLRSGLRSYLELRPDEFAPTVSAWLILIERGCCTGDLLQKIESPARAQLLRIFERGLQGESVLITLSAMDEEVQEQGIIEIETFLGQLPFRMLLPLLFFLFPAFLLLLLGPLLFRVLESMGGL